MLSFLSFLGPFGPFSFLFLFIFVRPSISVIIKQTWNVLFPSFFNIFFTIFFRFSEEEIAEEEQRRAAFLHEAQQHRKTMALHGPLRRPGAPRDGRSQLPGRGALAAKPQNLDILRNKVRY